MCIHSFTNIIIVIFSVTLLNIKKGCAILYSDIAKALNQTGDNVGRFRFL